MRKLPVLAALFVAVWMVGPVSAEDVVATSRRISADAKDAIVLEKLCGHAHALAAQLTAEHFQAVEQPEMLCWVELKHMNVSLVAYELTGDASHLVDFAAALGNLRASLKRGPDNSLGWRGKPIESRRDPARPDVETDDIQTDFRAVWVISRFLEIVGREERTKSEFGALREPLVDLMENHLIRKWHERGYWVDLGVDGGTYRMNNVKPPGNAISLPWEKLAIAVDGLLALYRVTGNDAHLTRVVKIGTLFKRRLQLKDGRYQWYRWVPLGRWDIDPANPAKWATWLGRSPMGSWYDAEVGIAVAMYHHGVVFDRVDMDRFAKNQVGTAWNGNIDAPEYFNCEGLPSDKKGQRFLCPALAPFNESLAAFLFAGKLQDERVEKSGSDWQGGVLAASWLWDKYVMMSAASSGRPMYADCGKRFMASEPNRVWAESLRFDVVEPGFRLPMTPDQTDPMPDAPLPAAL